MSASLVVQQHYWLSPASAADLEAFSAPSRSPNRQVKLLALASTESTVWQLLTRARCVNI